MEDFREDVFPENILMSAVHLGSTLAHFAPKSVKDAVSSFVDTLRWMLAEEPNEKASERTLDLEVIRALQEKYVATHPSGTPSPRISPGPNCSSPRRSMSQHVRWSPVCQTIYLNGEVENAPLRPCVEAKPPLSPLAF